MEECLICKTGFKKSKTVSARDGYYYLVCPNCSGGKLMPRNKALKSLKKAYLSEYFDWREEIGIRKFLNKVTLFTPYREWINAKFSSRGKLLDIGAGVPGFVLKMKEDGWDSYALEISGEQVKLIRKFLGQGKVWQGDFEKYPVKNSSFDILTYWHMLEHLTFPAEAIQKSAKVLRKNGMVFAEFPNFDSLNLRLFGKHYRYFDLPGHLVYYNKKSLQHLFGENGFNIVEISYPLKLNGSFSLNLSGLVYDLSANKTLAQLMFYLTLPVSIILSLLLTLTGQSDLMRIAAVKK